jgi:hypothetical protein
MNAGSINECTDPTCPFKFKPTVLFQFYCLYIGLTYSLGDRDIPRYWHDVYENRFYRFGEELHKAAYSTVKFLLFPSLIAIFIVYITVNIFKLIFGV